ncbi:MAG: ATPase with chaperone activity [Proteobacteria bacterium]|nr:ATPase with chaperone activity [Pseudomonadota bacterium]
MPDMNQIEIPQSFMALFVAAGRLKPSASLEVVAGRYELCEDMACMLTEHAQTMLSNSSLTEEDVLLRCHDGLMAVASVFTEQESDWVIRRLAELLAWTPPEFGEVASPSPRRTV